MPCLRHKSRANVPAADSFSTLMRTGLRLNYRSDNTTVSGESSDRRVRQISRAATTPFTANQSPKPPHRNVPTVQSSPKIAASDLQMHPNRAPKYLVMFKVESGGNKIDCVERSAA